MAPPAGFLEWDPEELSRAMHLPEEDVREYFTDGRRVAFIVERRAAREILKGRIASSEGANHDVVDAEGGKWESRSITERGMYFCPSYMVGSGRTFDEAGFLAKLQGIAGYLITDATEFPKMPYWKVSAAKVLDWWNAGAIGSSTKISRNVARRLLAEL